MRRRRHWQRAPSIRLPRSLPQPPGSDLAAPFVSFARALSPAGTTGFDAPSWALVMGWWVVLGLLAVRVLLRSDRARRRVVFDSIFGMKEATS